MNQKFYEIKQNTWKPKLLDKTTCSHCGESIVRKKGDKWIGQCDRCGAVHDFYVPTPIQKKYIGEPAQVIGWFGGYGGGKTVATAKKLQQHILSTPNGIGVAIAQTLQQLEENIIKEIKKFISIDWIENQVRGDFPKKGTWHFKNGFELRFVASDDPQKLRSANYTFIYMAEASKIPYGTYRELLARRRAQAGITYATDEQGNVVYEEDESGIPRAVVAKDGNQLIVESNPDMGWIRTKVLNRSNVVYHTPHVANIPLLKEQGVPNEGNFKQVSYVSATDDNPFITPDFLESTFAGESEEYINIHRYSDFSYKEGMIYPEAFDNFVEDFTIPLNWRTIMVHDPGYKDESAAIWASQDPYSKTWYVHTEYYESNRTYAEDALAFQKIEEYLGFNPKKIKRIVDPSLKQTRKVDGMSGVDSFRRLGFIFEPADNRIDEGIRTLKSLFAQGRIKIFKSLINMRKEFTGYKWEETKLGEHDPKPKPAKSPDHLMDTIRYLGMWVESHNYNDDPDDIIDIHVKEMKKPNMLNIALRIDEPEEDDTWSV